jgi:uncharacterized protein with PQ loop repeat
MYWTEATQRWKNHKPYATLTSPILIINRISFKHNYITLVKINYNYHQASCVASVFESNLINQSVIEKEQDVLHYNSFQRYLYFQKYSTRNVTCSFLSLFLYLTCRTSCHVHDIFGIFQYTQREFIGEWSDQHTKPQ